MLTKSRKFDGLVWVLFLGTVLGGCSLIAKPANLTVESPTQTITGKVTVVGAKLFVNDGTKTTEITSRKIDLKSYAGKTVTVVGEFSGTTLYVDEVK